MALQTSIAQYFNSRKRGAVDEINKVSNSNKVLILDKNITDVSGTNDCNTPTEAQGTESKKTIIYASPSIVKLKKSASTAPKLQRRTPKTVSGIKKKLDNQGCKKTDIRKSLLSSFNAAGDSSDLLSKQECNELTPKGEEELVLTPKKNEKLVSTSKNDELLVSTAKKGEALVSTPKKGEALVSTPIKAEVLVSTPKKDEALDSHEDNKVNVPFIVKGFLSPKKGCSNRTDSSPIQSNSASSASKQSNKESLKNLRSKIIRSSRLEEIKKSLKNLNEGYNKLSEIGSKLQSQKPDDSPSLKQFKTINIEVCSPTKKLKESSCIKVPSSPSLLRRSILMSPGKNQGPLPHFSPRKLFSETSPVKSFERFSHLSAKEKSSLALPYKYRVIAETFRAVDAVVSMLYNRNETILFPKLKSSVQQMSKRNLTETHLGQILTIYPNAFAFHQEKVRQGLGQPNKYELCIKPLLEKIDGESLTESKEETNGRSLMTPSIVLERRKKMFNALINLTKDHHQEFLKTLDPPLNLDKRKVTRWHPEFDVDSVPDIVASALPQPPNVDKFSSAKDVLNKARDIFICNPRMASALEKNSAEPQAQYTAPAAASIPALTSALKGIPKSLLEKVRAKQAAKAAAMLTRNPESVKRRIEYSRLPEIARIVRNTFLAEKKSALLKPLLLRKLNDSYREILTPVEMNRHLDLLIESNPEWITLINIRDEVYWKISKEMDLSVIYENIDKLIKQV